MGRVGCAWEFGEKEGVNLSGECCVSLLTPCIASSAVVPATLVGPMAGPRLCQGGGKLVSSGLASASCSLGGESKALSTGSGTSGCISDASPARKACMRRCLRLWAHRHMRYPTRAKMTSPAAMPPATPPICSRVRTGRPSAGRGSLGLQVSSHSEVVTPNVSTVPPDPSQDAMEGWHPDEGLKAGWFCTVVLTRAETVPSANTYVWSTHTPLH
mmetsp:Transcript_33326/g.84169  ORF Transcript_33326/g.84169 Transcript_33326/m.84169 type:complete len:214 (-) Transcript_33326:66-707(-)